MKCDHNKWLIILNVITLSGFTLNNKWRKGLSRMRSGHDDDQPLVVGDVPIDVVRDGHHWKLAVLLNTNQEIFEFRFVIFKWTYYQTCVQRPQNSGVVNIWSLFRCHLCYKSLKRDLKMIVSIDRCSLKFSSYKIKVFHLISKVK